MAVPAAGFVGLSRTDQDDRIVVLRRMAVDQALAVRRLVPADDTYRMKLIDTLGLGEEPGHRAKGLTTKIHVQARNNDPNIAAFNELTDYINKVRVEKLGLIYRNDRSVCLEMVEYLRRAANLERVGGTPLRADVPEP
jgi:hypothetical protein